MYSSMHRCNNIPGSYKQMLHQHNPPVHMCKHGTHAGEDSKMVVSKPTSIWYIATRSRESSIEVVWRIVDFCFHERCPTVVHFMSVHVGNNQSVYFTEDNLHERANEPQCENPLCNMSKGTSEVEVLQLSRASRHKTSTHQGYVMLQDCV